MTGHVRELLLIRALTSRFPRSPVQLNALQESDAELVRLPSGDTLAVTTDAVSEEITAGLYDDPYVAGWIVVAASMSDLAAVGASPLGILIAETLPPTLGTARRHALQQGIQDACAACSTFVLGGDTNEGPHLHLTGTGVGIVSGRVPLTRRGCRTDELLFATGPIGHGNVFAARRMLSPDEPAGAFCPLPRLEEGALLCGLASSCMDSSDGLFATLDQLSRINGIGFTLDERWEERLHPEVAPAAARLGIPLWTFLAGPHGEYELLFTVTPERASHLIELFRRRGGKPYQWGTVTGTPGVHLPGVGTFTPGMLASLRNASLARNGGTDRYLEFLRDLAALAEETTGV